MFDFINGWFRPKADLVRLIQEGALIVDVRTKAEYNAGHIKGSKNIPLDALKKEITALKNLNKPVVTVCRSGSRSEMAKPILSAAGIQAHNGGAYTDLKTKLLLL